MSADVGPAEIAEIALGAGGGGTLLWLLVKWLGGRQVEQLDETLKKLEATNAALSIQVQGLRESNIKIAEQLGGQAEGLKANKERIDESTKYWRESLKELAERVTTLERGRRTKP